MMLESNTLTVDFLPSIKLKEGKNKLNPPDKLTNNYSSKNPKSHHEHKT